VIGPGVLGFNQSPFNRSAWEFSFLCLYYIKYTAKTGESQKALTDLRSPGFAMPGIRDRWITNGVTRELPAVTSPALFYRTVSDSILL